MLRRPGVPTKDSDIDGHSFDIQADSKVHAGAIPRDLLAARGNLTKVGQFKSEENRREREANTKHFFSLPNRVRMTQYSQPLPAMTAPTLLIPFNPYRRCLTLANPNTDIKMYFTFGHPANSNLMIPLPPFFDSTWNVYPARSQFEMYSGTISLDEIWVYTTLAANIVAFEGVDAGETER